MAASRARTAPTTPAPKTAHRKSNSMTPPAATATKSAPQPTPRTQTPPAPDYQAPPVIRLDQIAERAYYIWLRKGRPIGQDHENWIEAEQELVGELRVAAQ